MKQKFDKWNATLNKYINFETKLNETIQKEKLYFCTLQTLHPTCIPDSDQAKVSLYTKKKCNLENRKFYYNFVRKTKKME